MTRAVALVAVLAIQSSGCITYATYKKLDTGETPLGTAAVLGLGETLVGDGVGVYASDRPGAPELSLAAWLAIGNAAVFGLDAAAALALYLLAQGS